jgi:hypothetical protein
VARPEDVNDAVVVDGARRGECRKRLDQRFDTCRAVVS